MKICSNKKLTELDENLDKTIEIISDIQCICQTEKDKIPFPIRNKLIDLCDRACASIGYAQARFEK